MFNQGIIRQMHLTLSAQVIYRQGDKMEDDPYISFAVNYDGKNSTQLLIRCK